MNIFGKLFPQQHNQSNQKTDKKEYFVLLMLKNLASFLKQGFLRGCTSYLDLKKNKLMSGSSVSELSDDDDPFK